MSALQTLADVLAPWQSAYSNSKTLSAGVTFVHLASLLFGGGMAVAADRATLRAAKLAAEAKRRVLEELDQVHRPVRFALTGSFVSGALLATADIQTFWSSSIYWAKMGLVLALIVNGAVLRSSERGARLAADANDEATQGRLWKRLTVTAWVSLVLWTSIVLAGTVLVGAA